MNENKELYSIGYFVSLLWLLVQIYGLSTIVLTIMGVLSIEYDIQENTLITVFFTMVGYLGLAFISGVFSYMVVGKQKKYWAALCLAQITGVPVSLLGVNSLIPWSLIIISMSLIAASYAFIGFMKLQTSLEVTEGISVTKNTRNILIGFFVITLLVAWNVWYENIWNKGF